MLECTTRALALLELEAHCGVFRMEFYWSCITHGGTFFCWFYPHLIPFVFACSHLCTIKEATLSVVILLRD